MLKGETVLSGAPHPGTPLLILQSGAGYYLGYLDTDGAPYSRETVYFGDYNSAAQVIRYIRGNEGVTP